MEAGAEIHAHHHAVGHRWIDLALASGALILSVTSIVIAIQNEHAMQRLVTANSWPYLTRVLPAREAISFLKVLQQEPNLELWKKLDAQRFKVGIAVCYSSVFGERWITTLGQVSPRSVKSCDVLSGAAYEAHWPTHK